MSKKIVTIREQIARINVMLERIKMANEDRPREPNGVRVGMNNVYKITDYRRIKK